MTTKAESVDNIMLNNINYLWFELSKLEPNIKNISEFVRAIENAWLGYLPEEPSILPEGYPED